jgi:hypothetical protein
MSFGPKHILCFGDSFTEGFTQGGTAFAPYSDAMASLLRNCGEKVEVVEEGESGDQVTAGNFTSRMEQRCMWFTFFYERIFDFIKLREETKSA